MVGYSNNDIITFPRATLYTTGNQGSSGVIQRNIGVTVPSIFIGKLGDNAKAIAGIASSGDNAIPMAGVIPLPTLDNTLLMAPIDVRLWEGKVRQPDIVFMSNEHLDRITEKMWGVPDLVVEILSEGTAEVDKKKKYREYQKAGVPEYWIVDPFNQVIEIYTLENSIYRNFGKWGVGEIAKSKLLDSFEVSVDGIMV